MSEPVTGSRAAECDVIIYRRGDFPLNLSFSIIDSRLRRCLGFLVLGLFIDLVSLVSYFLIILMSTEGVALWLTISNLLLC
jgi:hypothetical protein